MINRIHNVNSIPDNINHKFSCVFILTVLLFNVLKHAYIQLLDHNYLMVEIK